MTIAWVLLLSAVGSAWTIRSGRRQILSIWRHPAPRSGPGVAWNLSTTILWYGYLLVFFVGLSVNNIFR